MTLSKLAIEVSNAIREHKTTFTDINRRRTSLLELSALMLAVQHYERNGYKAIPRFGEQHKVFRPKWGSGGIPRKYSWWELTRDGSAYEAHLNAPVWDGHGGETATFVVDVGIITAEANIVFDPEKKKLLGFKNDDMATFIESKGIPIFPMLIAQFVGIVHEIVPWAIIGKTPRGFLQKSHFDPALVSNGYPRANTSRLLSGLADRRIRVRVVPAFEQYVEEKRLTSRDNRSVLTRQNKKVWPEIKWLK